MPSRFIRISGNPILIQTWGTFTPNSEQFLARRSFPWTINGQTTFYWLSRAELNLLDPNLAGGLSIIPEDGAAIFRALTGLKKPGVDDALKNTFESFKTYKDLPKTGAGSNKYQDWLAGPMPWDPDTAPAIFAAAFASALQQINNLPDISPDDPDRLNDTRCLNDKKNLRGLQYLSLMASLKAPMVVATLSVPPLTDPDRQAFFTLKDHENFTALFQLARTILAGIGLASY